jgi:malate dehydrogenase (oxaloacetate-decarboxylating)
MRDIRRVSFEVALAVAREARDAGLGRLLDDEELARLIRKAQWGPHFYPYRAGRLPV